MNETIKNISKKISIFKFSDGYYAVGREGEKKSFVPNLRIALILFKDLGGRLHLTSETQIKEIPKTFIEHMNE